MSMRGATRPARQSGSTRRHPESSAFTAVLPALAAIPVWLLSLAVWWRLIRIGWHVSFLAFAVGYLLLGVILFIRPIQVRLLAIVAGARRPTPDERAVLDTAWRSVLQANRLPRNRYSVAVLPADDLNAFACGGHLVVVTSSALATLPRDELAGVLAHELSHHLGLHTVALTISQWLNLPALVLARIGMFLQNVATAATDTFVRGSASLTAVGRLISAVLRAVSWVFLAGLLATNAIGNVVGRNAEFQADRRVVEMGFGRPLANALRRVMDAPTTHATRWERLWYSHPPARLRVVRIEAMLRQRRA